MSLQTLARAENPHSYRQFGKFCCHFGPWSSLWYRDHPQAHSSYFVRFSIHIHKALFSIKMRRAIVSGPTLRFNWLVVSLSLVSLRLYHNYHSNGIPLPDAIHACLIHVNGPHPSLLRKTRDRASRVARKSYRYTCNIHCDSISSTPFTAYNANNKKRKKKTLRLDHELHIIASGEIEKRRKFLVRFW